MQPRRCSALIRALGWMAEDMLRMKTYTEESKISHDLAE